MPIREAALLFWNVDKKDLTQSVVRLTQKFAINILILAEFDLAQDGAGLLTALNTPPRLPHENEFKLLEPIQQPHPKSAMSRLQIFTRLPLECWELNVMHNRYAVWTIALPDYRPFIWQRYIFRASSRIREIGSAKRQLLCGRMSKLPKRKIQMRSCLCLFSSVTSTPTHSIRESRRFTG